MTAGSRPFPLAPMVHPQQPMTDFFFPPSLNVSQMAFGIFLVLVLLDFDDSKRPCDRSFYAGPFSAKAAPFLGRWFALLPLFYYFDAAFTGALHPNPTCPQDAGLAVEISAAGLLGACLWQIHFDGSYRTICPEQLQAETG